MVSVVSFSKEEVELRYGRANVGGLSISVDSSGIAKANKTYYTWPGKQGSITVSDDGVFGYFIALSPGDYVGLVEYEKKLILFSRIVAPFSYSDFSFPPRWRAFLSTYLSIISSHERFISDLSFNILDLTRLLVDGKLGDKPFSLLLGLRDGALFRNGSGEWNPVSPSELALVLRP